MKRAIVLIFFLTISSGKLMSQTLTFLYEDGGNQIERKYCADCAAHSKSATNGLTDKKEFPPPEYQVKIYPNPTKDRATLVWSSELGSMIEKAEYVAYNFTQYRELKLDKRENKAVLDLSDQPIGMYVVIFYLTTGEKLTYKILKQ
ncbi:T9SS type A sorting domain-containing protein [Chryseobacterium aureum]|uniref:T9SS type A sorting domain-containing protein n=1 Tax=Chryseobacterium aureum TaxID=2497456 RepID=UPI000F876BE2|nr:T9SS type A sorting domain-containing protein [Chryseobacterium aureum]